MSVFNIIGKFITRFHILWFIFYAVLFGAVGALANYYYTTYDTDQLPSGNIELTLDKTEYQLGEIVTFTIVNHFPTTVYISNQCPKEPLYVYRWVNNMWVQIHDSAQKDGAGCLTQERNVPIPPNASLTYNFSNWPNLFTEPGVYRVAMIVDHYNEVPFQDFVILEPRKTVEVMEPLVTEKPAETTSVATEESEAELYEEESEEDEYEYEEEYEDEYEYEDDEHEDEEDEEDEHEDRSHEDEEDERDEVDD